MSVSDVCEVAVGFNVACETPTETARLVEATRAGDKQAFTRLYEMYGAMVHGILLAHVPAQEVDDLMQEVFTNAFARLASLRETEAFGGWLAAMTRHAAIDFFRRRKPTEPLVETSSIADCRQPLRAEATEVLRCVRALPTSYRETLILRLVEGMTANEIAVQTGMTEASVRVNLHRGMKLLRAKLTKGVDR